MDNFGKVWNIKYLWQQDTGIHKPVLRPDPFWARHISWKWYLSNFWVCHEKALKYRIFSMEKSVLAWKLCVWSKKFPQNCSAKRELPSSRVLTKSLEFAKKKLDRWDPWVTGWEQMGKANSPEILSVNAYYECLSRLLHEKGLNFKKERQRNWIQI